MNEVVNAVLNRRSIRAYTNEKLTDDELTLLKKAALAAPTAMNRNNQRFLFVTKPEVISEIETEVVESIRESGDEAFLQRILSRNGKVIYDAPLFIGIFGMDSHYKDVDAGIAVENIALTAKSLGLDSVILGMPRSAFCGMRGEKLQARFGIPAEFKFSIGIAVGHPAMDKKPHDMDESHIIELKD